MFDIPSLVCRIGTVPHFSNLTVSDLQTIVSSGVLVRFRKGTTILREGEPCSGMFVLLIGKVHLSKTGPQGQSTIVGVIKPVIMFNEVAVLDGDCNPVSATAIKDSFAWQISYERFHMLMERYPPLGLSLLKVMAKRNRMLMGQYEDIAFRTVMGRTAKILLDLSKNGQVAISRREHSNLELAAKAATVPEPISRSIQALRQDGLICCDRDYIKICQPQRLAQLAEIHIDLILN
jgi:CRP-like cAMP-binding protein